MTSPRVGRVIASRGLAKSQALTCPDWGPEGASVLALKPGVPDRINEESFRASFDPADSSIT